MCCFAGEKTLEAAEHLITNNACVNGSPMVRNITCVWYALCSVPCMLVQITLHFHPQEITPLNWCFTNFYSQYIENVPLNCVNMHLHTYVISTLRTTSCHICRPPLTNRLICLLSALPMQVMYLATSLFSTNSHCWVPQCMTTNVAKSSWMLKDV